MPPIGDWLTFHWYEPFGAAWAELGLDDAALARLQAAIVADPRAGDVVPGAGGLRKVRFAPAGRGKSGGVRVCYALFPDAGAVLLVTVFGKGEKADLSAAERRYVRHLIDEFGDDLGSTREP